MNFTNSNNTDKNRPAEHIKHASLHLLTPSAPLCLRLADSTHYLQLLYQSSGYNFIIFFLAISGGTDRLDMHTRYSGTVQSERQQIHTKKAHIC